MEALPPQIVGPDTGVLLFKILSCKLTDGAQPVGSKIKFEWWGSRNSPAILSIPWKGGVEGNEAKFPLRSDKTALKDYMDDMAELKLDLIDSKNKCFGKATFSLSKFARAGLEDFSGDGIEVFKPQAPGATNKRLIGHLKLAVSAKFFESSPAVVSADKSVLLPAKELTRSPIRGGGAMNSRGGRIISSEAISNRMPAFLGSFQKNEALVFTDNSDKYAEWPELTAAGPSPTFVPSGLGRISQTVPKPLSPPRINRTTTPGTVPTAATTAATAPVEEETTNPSPPLLAVRAPLVRAAARKKREEAKEKVISF